VKERKRRGTFHSTERANITNNIANEVVFHELDKSFRRFFPLLNFRRIEQLQDRRGRGGSLILELSDTLNFAFPLFRFLPLLGM
jgi:hypothetical protein